MWTVRSESRPLEPVAEPPARPASSRATSSVPQLGALDTSSLRKRGRPPLPEGGYSAKSRSKGNAQCDDHWPPRPATTLCESPEGGQWTLRACDTSRSRKDCERL